jgi:NAD-dependent deacetylase
MRVVFFSGSGLSADSGIPTFRGRAGLYAKIDPVELLSDRTLRRDPGQVHEFLDGFRESLRDYEPNPAHAMIRRWQERHPETVVITMNIDDMLERAGCVDVVHLHGEVRCLQSAGDPSIRVDIGYRRYWSGAAGDEPSVAITVGDQRHDLSGYQFRCPLTQSLFRPDVVLFGELAPKYQTLWSVLSELGDDDVFVSIGASGQVIPVGRISTMLPCFKILNNLDRVPEASNGDWDREILAPAAIAAAEIEALLEARLESGQRSG